MNNLKWMVLLLKLLHVQCCSITGMVLTFTSCHFRSHSMLRPHLTHSCASRKLHRVFPNASLRLCRSVADSVTINLSFGYRIVVDGQISRDTRSCCSRKHQYIGTHTLRSVMLNSRLFCSCLTASENTQCFLRILYIIFSSACPRKKGSNLIMFFVRRAGRHLQWAVHGCWQEVK
jgi:hypothetical protein